MQSFTGYPNPDNKYLCGHAERIIASWHHWIGTDLIDPNLPIIERARELFHAEFVVLSHDTAPDPILNYANYKALTLFELAWDELVRTPSRLTAEPLHREARAALLAQVSNRGYMDDYRGVRVSRTGRRFLIERATVWNLLDENGAFYGQAATFRSWKFLNSAESN